MENGTYNKKSNNHRESNRVDHIKAKKERLKEEQIEREGKRMMELSTKKKDSDEFEIDENFGKKNKNNKKSKKKKHEISDSDSD